MALNRLRKGQFFSVGEREEETSAGNICLRWLSFPTPPVPTNNHKAPQCWSWDYKWPTTSTRATNLHKSWRGSSFSNAECTRNEGTRCAAVFSPKRGYWSTAGYLWMLGPARPILSHLGHWPSLPGWLVSSRFELSSPKGCRTTILLHSGETHSHAIPRKEGS